MISRVQDSRIKAKLGTGKIALIFGPRQVGKTTLLKQLEGELPGTVYLNADQPDVQAAMAEKTSTALKAYIGGHPTVMIDEAQRLENAGLTLKLLIDNYPNMNIIATGSSSFELHDKLQEPLTGRKWEYFLHPLSFAEMVKHHGLIEERRLLEHRLVYGYYPEVVTTAGNEKSSLTLLTTSYLYKDVLSLEGIKKPRLLQDLVTALAFQVSQEVSYNELSNHLQADRQTIDKYITLLEQSFVVFRLSSLSRNLRNELKRSRKIYFYDNGVRNAIINNFNPLGLRDDVGRLWENFLVAERMKANHYNGRWCNRYFWRTHTSQEVDYIEEEGGKLSGFEFKWKEPRTYKVPKAFSEAYPNSTVELITQENFESFVKVE